MQTIKHFQEIQRLRQWWVLTLIALAAGTTWFMTISQFVFQKPLGNNPAGDVEMWVIFIAAGILLPLMIVMIKLKVEVRLDGVYIRFYPFHLKERRFAFSEIKEAQAVEYKPIREFGGWGIRWGRSGMAYSISGSQGVRLTLHNGRQILVGSQKKDELIKAIYDHK